MIDAMCYGPDGKWGSKWDLKTTRPVRCPFASCCPGNRDRRLPACRSSSPTAAASETLVRPIPIVLKKLNVDLFPEGGDLVAGVPNASTSRPAARWASRPTSPPVSSTTRARPSSTRASRSSCRRSTTPSNPAPTRAWARSRSPLRRARSTSLQVDEPSGIKLVHPASSDQGRRRRPAHRQGRARRQGRRSRRAAQQGRGSQAAGRRLLPRPAAGPEDR